MARKSDLNVSHRFSAVVLVTRPPGAFGAAGAQIPGGRQRTANPEGGANIGARAAPLGPPQCSIFFYVFWEGFKKNPRFFPAQFPGSVLPNARCRQAPGRGGKGIVGALK